MVFLNKSECFLYTLIKCFFPQIVAPFPGYISRTNRDDEVVIKATGGSLQDVNIYITNIHPEGVDHPSDENDKGKLVSDIYIYM